MYVECAPMAGYTNFEFRKVLADLGARVLYTEMVSVAAMYYGAQRSNTNEVTCYGNKKTLELLKHEKRPGLKNVVQLFGHEEKHFDFAIRSGLLNDFDEININMGCPANKILKNNEGAALMTSEARHMAEEPATTRHMKAPGKASSIVMACRTAVRESGLNIPITVKIRLGDKPGFDYVTFAKQIAAAGAQKIIVHGRYASQGYSGTANHDAICEIVAAVAPIPVIANGDIKTAAMARTVLDQTGASGVMIGRVMLPAFRKYFPNKLQILRGEKICREGGVAPNTCNLNEFFV